MTTECCFLFEYQYTTRAIFSRRYRCRESRRTGTNNNNVVGMINTAGISNFGCQKS